jgi:hypothetical protein
LPTYDDDGTETARRIETHKWYRRSMGVQNVGSLTRNVLGAAVGDDNQSWYPFEKSLTALLRIEDFGLAQVDTIQHEYGDTGAVTKEIQETSAWYSQRTAIAGVPWFLNANGAGQKDIIANFQRVARKTTTNGWAGGDGSLAGRRPGWAGRPSCLPLCFEGRPRTVPVLGWGWPGWAGPGCCRPLVIHKVLMLSRRPRREWPGRAGCR